ncbi:hypothetical protein DVH24_040412 [Malus domestica]|uniref:Rieske domain-containing protein n=1 Tax=Malus domestica TaxID=3750 RepID=A0A498IBB1_MALDO|nr:hypothetical protein DVH24_040412 [Malus domestica]
MTGLLTLFRYSPHTTHVEYGQGLSALHFQCPLHGTEWNGTGRDRAGRNGEGVKMHSDGNKEEEEGDGEVIILCSTDVERVVPGGEAERKFTQNSYSAFHWF